ncbi:MAG: c-type cytochrome [Acidobacteria bacterium]|nr:MAG: c-type cytochrome [Acidobacteriota bacterium]
MSSVRLCLLGLVWASVATAGQVPTEPDAMFDAFCAVCHGEDGRGQVENPAIDSEPMDFTDCAVATPEPDGDWDLVITRGGMAAGLSSEMPSYGDALTGEQIQALIGYIRGFCAEPGWPIGTLNFPRPIFTEKAFPENEFLLLPEFSSGADGVTELALQVIYERRLGRRGHVEVRFPFESVSAAGERRSGLSDVKLAGKYVVNTDRAMTRITTVGLEVSLPTGDEDDGLGHGTAVFEPYLAFGTTLGDLYLQTQLKVESPARDPVSGAELGYNVYVGFDVSEFLTTWTVGLELNGEGRDLAVTPQLRKGLTRTGAIAVAGGVQIPLTNRDVRRARWVGYFLWEYLDPVFAVKN